MATYKLAGRAKKFDGTAIDYVSMFNWADGKCLSQTKPSPSGEWVLHALETGDVGLTYVANGCEPITHGAYPVTVTKHKWWRVKNIKPLGSFQGLEIVTIASLVFFNPKDVDISTIDSYTVISSAGYADARGNPQRVFDNNVTTYWLNDYRNMSAALTWIGVEFDTPVLLKDIGLIMRQDAMPEYQQEWQTADVEYSDDGVTWTKYGVIEPRIENMNKSMVTTPIIFD